MTTACDETGLAGVNPRHDPVAVVFGVDDPPAAGGRCGRQRGQLGRQMFRQRRNGFNQREVRVFKFRTMSTLDDGDVIQQATRNDGRVTRRVAPGETAFARIGCLAGTLWHC